MRMSASPCVAHYLSFLLAEKVKKKKKKHSKLLRGLASAYRQSVATGTETFRSLCVRYRATVKPSSLLVAKRPWLDHVLRAKYRTTSVMKTRIKQITKASNAISLGIKKKKEKVTDIQRY